MTSLLRKQQCESFDFYTAEYGEIIEKLFLLFLVLETGPRAPSMLSPSVPTDHSLIHRKLLQDGRMRLSPKGAGSGDSGKCSQGCSQGYVPCVLAVALGGKNASNLLIYTLDPSPKKQALVMLPTLASNPWGLVSLNLFGQISLAEIIPTCNLNLNYIHTL